MDEEEYDSQEETDRADRDVGDSQEGILPTEQWRRRYDHALWPTELGHPESWKSRNVNNFEDFNFGLCNRDSRYSISRV